MSYKYFVAIARQCQQWKRITNTE